MVFSVYPGWEEQHDVRRVVTQMVHGDGAGSFTLVLRRGISRSQRLKSQSSQRDSLVRSRVRIYNMRPVHSKYYDTASSNSAATPGTHSPHAQANPWLVCTVPASVLIVLLSAWCYVGQESWAERRDMRDVKLHVAAHADRGRSQEPLRVSQENGLGSMVPIASPTPPTPTPSKCHRTKNYVFKYSCGVASRLHLGG